MNKAQSTYLDLLRLLAAIGVFINHSATTLTPWVTPLISGHGSECVAVFFVLSGFVISYVAENRERDASTYIVARIGRLYSVALLAILVTLVADYAGNSINQEIYTRLSSEPRFYQAPSWPAVLSYLTFTNELWLTHKVVGTNSPYWSLGFEVPYYVIFGIALFARGNVRTILLGAAALIVGPKILAYLPLWLMGSLTFKLCERVKPSLLLGGLLMATSVLIYVATRTVLWQFFVPMYHPWSIWALAKGVIYFYPIGLAVAINLIGFSSVARHTEIKVFESGAISNSISWLAGASFTLYLMHLPLVFLAASVVPDIAKTPTHGVVSIFAIYAITLILAEFGERRKVAFRNAARYIFTRIPLARIKKGATPS
ncbi:acyltransferase [Bradyrhizobium sp. 157]|uniref:acyltransferase family protein n=1 Tax=Bradyrhizobium sp. 157 TaxID=2782631 RepID=UPI001FFA0B21|nr:acyltransferase [Bradyrhizobium sp. 157]MCK1642984.1 acyltransferase [Bradyrhizobium sp. 157]